MKGSLCSLNFTNQNPTLNPFLSENFDVP